MSDQDEPTKIVVFMVAVRLPLDESLGWSVHAIETKSGYWDDIVDSEAFEIRREDLQ